MQTNKMYTFGWIASCLSAMLAVLSGVNCVNITEPGRQTKIFGRNFFVVLPLSGGVPQEGSSLQIACVSSPSSQATGSIAPLWESSSQAFNASPTTSISLSAFEPFSSNETAVLNITSDSDITVAVIIQISGTLSAYAAIPLASLDRYYPVASYSLQEDNLSELTVVAYQPDTGVEFKLRAENVTVHSFYSSLDTGESVTYRTPERFSGGELLCTSPVAGVVRTRCKSQREGCAHSLHTLYPLVSLGTRYAAVPVDDGKNQFANIFRVVAIWDKTSITLSSGRRSSQTYWNDTFMLNSGQVYDRTFADTVDARGSKPFLVLHHVEKGFPVQDTALVTVPPVEQLTRQTLTFSTYDGISPGKEVQNYISIMAPCKELDNIWLQYTAGPQTSPEAVTRSSATGGEYCGSSRRLDKKGTYTIGPSPNSPGAAYSAILYGFTDSGIFAYILATELYQITCQVVDAQVQLCPPESSLHGMTTQPTLSASNTEVPTAISKKQTGTTTQPTPSSSNTKVPTAISTIVAVIVAVISIIAGSVVIGYILFRYCRGRKWRRLEESEYMEDNPIRMNVMESGQSDL